MKMEPLNDDEQYRAHEVTQAVGEAVHKLVNDMLLHEASKIRVKVRDLLTENFRFWD